MIIIIINHNNSMDRYIISLCYFWTNILNLKFWFRNKKKKKLKIKNYNKFKIILLNKLYKILKYGKTNKK